MRNAPKPLLVPLMTRVARPRETGAGSPVSDEVSSSDSPSRTTPSHGTRSPGRISSTSPIGDVVGGTSIDALVAHSMADARRGCLERAHRG